VAEIIYPSSKSWTISLLHGQHYGAKTLIILIMLTGYSQSIAGATLPEFGPGLAFELYNPNHQKNSETANETSQTKASVSTKRYHAWILAPIPAAVFSGLLTAQGSIISESEIKRVRNVIDENNLTNGQTINTRRVTKVGLRWHPHHKEGAPKYFLLVERTGLPDKTQSIKPIASITLGTAIGEDDLPIPINFRATDLSNTRLHVTIHHFSQFYRFEVGVGHKLKIKNGLFLDILIPEYALIGFQAAHEAFSIGIGASRKREFFPWHIHEKKGWSEELNEKRKIQLKWKLHKPIHLAIDGGYQRRKQLFLTEHEEKMKVGSTEFAPFMRLALETWLSVL